VAVRICLGLPVGSSPTLDAGFPDFPLVATCVIVGEAFQPQPLHAGRTLEGSVRSVLDVTCEQGQLHTKHGKHGTSVNCTAV
jgi:hypothetical protein